MATDITNGKGGVVSVTATAQLIAIVPATGTAGNHKNALTVKVSNEGASTIYAVVNCNATDQSDGAPFYVEASAVPIAPDKDFWFVGQPIKKLVLACATGETSTANYGAY